MGVVKAGGRESLAVAVPGGQLGGWVAGDGAPVLLLHGGPGLSYDYLDELAAELGEGYRTAVLQQRGLSPSTTTGPFTIPQAIDDVIAVLDSLGWDEAFLVGDSWGGHLAMRVAAVEPRRVRGVLAINPLGIVGDGGAAAFSAELFARTPVEDRERARRLNDLLDAGQGTLEDALDWLGLVWPAYFADPVNAPPMHPLRFSLEANLSLCEEMLSGLDEVVAGLRAGGTPCAFLAGAGGPMPWGQACRASADVIPGAVVEVVPAAGNFPWLEVPGSVRAALERLRVASAPRV